MIPAADVREAAAIIRTATSMLLATSNNQQGRAGSDLRRACGDLALNAEKYIAYNQVAYKLAYCFDQARATGATMSEFNEIYEAMAAETPVSLIATLMASSCVAFSLQQVSLVVMATTFTNRENVDSVRLTVDEAFRDAEEVAADAMALTTYKTLVALHAAVLFHLYQTAQPLPQMLDFQFAAIRPTLVQSYRLYADASRADELRAENKVVHPAFAPRTGRALSF
jgi:prophage DNA circulation protein